MTCAIIKPDSKPGLLARKAGRPSSNRVSSGVGNAHGAEASSDWAAAGTPSVVVRRSGLLAAVTVRER